MSETALLADDRDRSQWQGHRVAAVVVRTVVFACPVSVAVCLGLLVSHSVPGHGTGATALRVVITAGVSVPAFLLVERLGRRFLPLAALLRLNLVFPDRAPSRFSVALRSTSVRKLQQWVGEARETENAAALAEKVVTLASALNTHDRRTRGHCERTRALADLIIEELHLPPAEANEVRWGAFLHDIGKLVVPSEILNKPGKPTAREWEVLKSHPEAGARLVEPLRSFLNAGVDAVASHHEHYDGSGYPAGLSGGELPLAARIVSVADSFEVMTAVRAYKRPMSLQAAREELARSSGTQFDPQVVRAFLNVSLGRVHWTLGMAAWLAEVPFVGFVPRLAARVGATTGPGGLAPVALPSIAAASLGAMAVIAPADAPARSPSVPAASAPASRVASTSPSTSGPAPTATSGEHEALTPVPLTDGSVPPLVDASLPAVAPAAGATVDAARAAVGSAVVGNLNAVVHQTAATVDAVDPFLARPLSPAKIAETVGTTAGDGDELLGRLSASSTPPPLPGEASVTPTIP
jgi:putative nucleotidyltransferase with HDIG domain